MAGYKRKNSSAPLLVTILFVVAAVAVAWMIPYFTGGNVPEDEYPWVKADEMAVSGSLSGESYSGKRNDAATLSYSIAEEIKVKVNTATLKIENPGKNVLLMTVTITVGEEQIYQTGYLKPGQYILSDTLDTPLDPGTYQGVAVFEGFDPETEESKGAIDVNIRLSVE
ncbi:MAG TPA: hypothetical protein PLU82_02685 [Oscillospiraceae bacterium]|nr:hypothetical protein [Oscillospiraceae bacterium]